MSAAQELRAAHAIIRNALAVMNTAQKFEWGVLNERDNVHGEGVTRANEREASLAKANDLAHELARAAALFDSARPESFDIGRVSLSPAGAARLTELLVRAAAALADPNTPTKEA